jgi:hypothetical protein
MLRPAPLARTRVNFAAAARHSGPSRQEVGCWRRTACVSPSGSTRARRCALVAVRASNAAHMRPRHIRPAEQPASGVFGAGLDCVCPQHASVTAAHAQRKLPTQCLQWRAVTVRVGPVTATDGPATAGFAPRPTGLPDSLGLAKLALEDDAVDDEQGFWLRPVPSIERGRAARPSGGVLLVRECGTARSRRVQPRAYWHGQQAVERALGCGAYCACAHK